MLEVHAILQRQRCNENMTEKTGTLSDAYEAIRQNGKIILHGNDGISIKMIFRNLTGRNFQGQEYADYISHIAIGSMGFTPGSIEHCRDGGVIDTGTIPNV